MTATLAPRGRTTLSDQAVERVATQAVTEVADVGGAAHWLLGETLNGTPEKRSAQVSATVDDTTAALHVRLSIAYPASVARTTEQVRDHLIRRLHELTGLVVTRVDITVVALYLNQPGPRRVR
ncbi:Asp23/Gls24 family envelope stress response protein [Actinophytocola gossypii]|uniref:Asp23/Gls24 family envelope stress response protein n=1 Tax=Actinophytocola gossypii TaxID=2812003 RepID=A0ABT2JJ82_9PSEU|nr:alkaline shock response membrane anchor protein AmaP [Actinophytocola gossypii]MCT2587942.1 Asp23/Gls24 family envelope stress response protein [Actinophytocola gossypii]